MMRLVLSTTLGLMLVAGAGLARAADDKKKDPTTKNQPSEKVTKSKSKGPVTGTIKKVDAKKNTLTLTVGKDSKDVDIKVTKSTKFHGFMGKKLSKGLKDPHFKKSAMVKVDYDPATMNAKEITLLKNKKSPTGEKTVKSNQKPSDPNKK
jgi:hypothetical protein